MSGVAEKKIGSNEKTLFPMLIGALKGTRTPDPLLRRQMLYPAELQAHINGAGDGNRTHATSLEG